MDAPALSKPPRPKSHIKWWQAILVLLIVFGGLGCGLHFANQPKDGATVESVEADALASLPVGSNEDAAVAWFIARGYSEYGETTDTKGKKTGYRALVPNDSWLEKAEIEIVLKYESRKLAKVQVSRILVR